MKQKHWIFSSIVLWLTVFVLHSGIAVLLLMFAILITSFVRLKKSKSVLNVLAIIVALFLMYVASVPPVLAKFTDAMMTRGVREPEAETYLNFVLSYIAPYDVIYKTSLGKSILAPYQKSWLDPVIKKNIRNAG